MKRNLWLLMGVGAVLASTSFADLAPVKSSVGDGHDQDRAAIRESLNSFAKDFQKRDAQALAAHWTSEGEMQTVHGVTLHGHEDLVRAFSAFFAQTPEVLAEIQLDSSHFLSADCAIAEGRTMIRKGAAEPATKSRFSALMLREKNHWKLASLTEFPDDTQSIEDLAWLIGDWKSLDGQGAEIHTSYAWDASHHFIRAQFDLKEGKRTLSGSQVIGVDPATGSLHTWTFEATGGVGNADWTPDGDHWILEAAGTKPNGSTLNESNILRRINEDAFTWQSVNRTLNGEAIPDQPPVKVTRIQAKK